MAKKIVVKQKEPAAQPATPPPQPMKGFFSRYVLILFAILAIMMMFDTNLRFWFGSAVGTVFYPIVGFDKKLPFMTLFCAGLIMTVISTAVRHYFTNWIETAKTQKKMAAFNKARMEALKSKNTNKLNRMSEAQKQVNEMNFGNMVSQLKSTAVMMFIAIAVFAWIWLFVESLPNKSFSTPWVRSVSFVSVLPCCMPLPLWIAIYSLISLPLGMVFARLLKHYSFKKRLAELEMDWRGKGFKRKHDESDVDRKSSGSDWGKYSFVDKKESAEQERDRKRR